MVRISWSPMRITGLSEFIAPCGTIATRANRACLTSAWLSWIRSVPSSKVALPPAIKPGVLIIRNSARISVVLPLPDSPTSPKRSPL